MYQNACAFFEKFVHQYPIDENDIRLESYYFKYRHTYDVVKRMKELIGNKKEKDLYLTVALFHDLGRFVQLEKFRYYNDVKTKFDHAKESVMILEENHWFTCNNISEKTKDIMEFAILNHNKMFIDACEGLKKDLTETLRDADKIGILDRKCVTGGDVGEVSDDVYEAFAKEKLVPYTLVMTEADGILAEIAFVFDLSKRESLRIVQRDRVLDSRLNLLKTSKRYESICRILENYFKSMV